MQTYIGVKSIEARPMNLGEYNTYRGWKIPDDEDPARPGYLVKYSDSYESWSPKEQFESAYFPVQDPNKLHTTDIMNFISSHQSSKLDGNTVLSTTILKNGFKAYNTSSCIDPKNFSIEIGAAENKKKAMNGMWELLGFVMLWAKNGLK